jgi:GTP cyclohydrolase I
MGPVYGVPRGGAVVAGLLGRAVDRWEDADVIVDDIVDSGAIRARWLARGKRFWALVDKPAEGLTGVWVRFPWEDPDPLTDLADTVTRQLEWLGEDPRREGLRETPARVLRALWEMTEGYRQDPQAALEVTFTEPCDQMVLVRAIPFASLCEHHVLPFIGTATVGYLPKGNRVVGLSKIPRLVHAFAKRLQTQERLTSQVAEAFMTALQPLGVGVLIEAQHSCMQLRGVRSAGAMLTSCLLGVMRDKGRAEFLRLARSR